MCVCVFVCACVRGTEDRASGKRAPTAIMLAGTSMYISPKFSLLPHPVLALPSLRFHATGPLWTPSPLHLDKRLAEQELCSPFPSPHPTLLH